MFTPITVTVTKREYGEHIVSQEETDKTADEVHALPAIANVKTLLFPGFV